MAYSFAAELWIYPGDGGWHFITLPFDVTDEIDEITTSTKRGFGSVRVIATIGSTRFATSIFPDTKRRSFVLPVKKAVRSAEKVTAGDTVTVRLELADH